MPDERTQLQTEPPMGGQQGVAGHLWSHLAIAQDEVGEDGKHRATPGARDPPDGDPTEPDTEVVRMARQTPTSLTRRLMGELTAEGEEESAHAFHKGLAVAKQLNVGRVVSKIDSDGAVFAGLFGRCAHVSPPGHQVSSADETRWGEHADEHRYCTRPYKQVCPQRWCP